ATCWLRPKFPQNGGEGSTPLFCHRFTSSIENWGLGQAFAWMTSACWVSIWSFSESSNRLFCRNKVSASARERRNVSCACNNRVKCKPPNNKRNCLILQYFVLQKCSYQP